MNWGEVGAGTGRAGYVRWLSNRVSRKPDDILRQRGVPGDSKIVRFLVRCKQAWDTCHMDMRMSCHVSTYAHAMQVCTYTARARVSITFPPRAE